MAGDAEHRAKLGALRMARAIELERRREEVESVRVPHPFELLPAPQFFDRDTGRPLLSPDAPLVYIGRYFRRSRAYTGLSQAQLAGKADVSQSMVSRVERGRAPGMAFDRFADMCLALGRLFPFGVCPHDHRCGWQPIAAPDPPGEAATFIEQLLRYAGDD
jgi:DNA-binding XRE family transcriptional regulator